MPRYIDADELRKLFDEITLSNGESYCSMWEFCDKPSDIQFLIDDQPTADVRKNVHAKKVIGGGERDGATCWFECSHCHGAVDIEDAYCKHCGADMRGDNK